MPSPPSPPLDDQRTAQISPLLSPSLLRHELPVDGRGRETVARGRAEVVDVLDGRDDRLLVVVGPCSVHDPDAALDYAAPAGRARRSVCRRAARS